VHNGITNALLCRISKSVVCGHEEDHLQSTHEKKKYESDDESELDHRLSTLTTPESSFGICSSRFSGSHILH
jgi:hypothetical protein